MLVRPRNSSISPINTSHETTSICLARILSLEVRCLNRRRLNGALIGPLQVPMLQAADIVTAALHHVNQATLNSSAHARPSERNCLCIFQRGSRSLCSDDIEDRKRRIKHFPSDPQTTSSKPHATPVSYKGSDLEPIVTQTAQDIRTKVL